MTNVDNIAEQQNALETSSAALREQAYLMKKAIDTDSLRDTLRYASSLIGELRTSSLSPRSYYQLYLLACQELHHLQVFVEDRARHGRKLSELYESVQHAGNILPRLYLLVAVGAAYVKAGEAPSAGEVLRDVAELCRGVQHPVRGLFLRHYLSQSCRDALPTNPAEACDWVLNNFVEATKLWIRLAQQPGLSAGARQRREKERHELRVLVGSNLVRLSQVEGVSKEYYSAKVLPVLLEQITTNFQDNLAQQYLLDCIVQVFPDEFHVATISALLAGCAKTLPSVDLRPVLMTLMRRLRDYAASGQSLPSDLFGTFRLCLERVIARPPPPAEPAADSPAVAVGFVGVSDNTERCAQLLELLHAFLEFACAAETGGSEGGSEFQFRVSSVLKMVLSLLAGVSEGGSNLAEVLEAGEQIDDIFASPLVATQGSVAAVLRLPEYASLTALLPQTSAVRARIASKVVNSLVQARREISDPETLTRLLTLLSPLANSDCADLPVWAHCIKGVDGEADLTMLQALRAFYPSNSPLLGTALPTLNGVALKLLAVGEHAVSQKKVFHFVHRTCASLVSKAAETALTQWLIGAQAAAACSLEAIAEEFFTQALICFEEEIPATGKTQLKSLSQITNALILAGPKLEKEHYDSLTVKCAQFASRLLKKSDQCRAICTCAHLFWNENIQDARRLLDCLQKALKIADSCLQAQGPAAGAELFLDILDKYLYFYERTDGVVNSSFVNNLIALCREHVAYSASHSVETPEVGEALNAQLRVVIDFVKKQQTVPELKAKFSAVIVDAQ